MECVEGALKSSFRPETLVKTTHHQPFLDDLWPVNAQRDDFFVDDLLDLSKDDDFVQEDEDSHEEKNPDPKKVTTCYLPTETFNNSGVPDSELCLPADDVAHLEWLSNFVDDTFNGYSLTCPAGKVLPVKPPVKNPFQPELPALAKQSFTTPVQTKARSKRARTGGRVWSLGSPPSFTDSSTSSSSSSSCTSNSNLWLIVNDLNQTAESFLGKPVVKKQKKKNYPASHVAGGGQQPRRCSHCLVQKTPQWRAGPLGAKTLCNACGVRYKSGRLLPEYRPACSPTFSSEVHSNNHRKVLEMRRKKEVEAGPALPVQSV